MKLTIFPGTFNPVHNGHLMIGESACSQFGLQKVRLIVSPFPPNKLNSRDFLPIEKRIQLLEIAIQDNPRFEIDLREIKRSGLSYTIETVYELIEEFNYKEKINFIMGVDSFLSLPSWQKADELGKYCKFLIASRPGWQKIDVEDSLSSFHDELEWEIIDSPPLAISSTQIRSRKREQKSYRYLLPKDVYDIYRNFEY